MIPIVEDPKEKTSITVTFTPRTVLTLKGPNPAQVIPLEVLHLNVPIGITVHKGEHSYKLLDAVPDNYEKYLEDVPAPSEITLAKSMPIEMHKKRVCIDEDNFECYLPEKFTVIVPKNSILIDPKEQFFVLLMKDTEMVIVRSQSIISSLSNIDSLSSTSSQLSHNPPKKEEVVVIASDQENNNNNNRSQRDYNEQLSIACGNGDLNAITRWLSLGADINNTDYEDKSPLTHAIQKSYLSVVKLLVDKNVMIRQNHIEIASLNRFWKITNILVNCNDINNSIDGLNTSVLFKDLSQELSKFYNSTFIATHTKNQNDNDGNLPRAAIAYLAGNNAPLSLLFFGPLSNQLVPMSV